MYSFESSKNTEKISILPENKLSKRCSVLSIRKVQPSFRRIASLGNGISGSGAVGHVAVFVLKIAALETVRRVSKAKCPFVWRGIQALQVLCYPPFKWIQRLAPFKGLVKGVQVCS